jgi:hypothetical protein
MIVGILFLLFAFSAIIEGQVLVFVFSLLIAIICIPPISDFVEKKINYSLSKNIRFGSVCVLFILLMITAPHITQPTSTSINANPSNAQQASINVPVATPTQIVTPSPTPVETPTQTPASTPKSEVTSSPIPTPSSEEAAAPIENDTQITDLGWVMDSNRDSIKIGNDLENAGTDMSNADYPSMAIDGQKIVDDTQQALFDCQQHTVSSKYTDAKTEWESCLWDFDSAGTGMKKVSDDVKNNGNNSAYT